MRAEPGHAERQREARGRRRGEEMRQPRRRAKPPQSRCSRHRRSACAAAERPMTTATAASASSAAAQTSATVSVTASASSAARPGRRHGSRALSEMSSMPSASSAATSFISESTLPRITPSLASMRWMVGSDSPAASASLRWSMPRSAREARSWPAVIMEITSELMFRTYILMFSDLRSVLQSKFSRHASTSSASVGRPKLLLASNWTSAPTKRPPTSAKSRKRRSGLVNRAPAGRRGKRGCRRPCRRKTPGNFARRRSRDAA